jgi:hypothetical protein
MKINNRIVYVFDNEGDTLDRYTVLINSTSEILGCNAYPFHPMGIGQHCGTAAENKSKELIGRNSRNLSTNKNFIRRAVSSFVREARANIKWLGKELTDPAILPKDVLQFITQNL